jgi:hypothetical protein
VSVVMWSDAGGHSLSGHAEHWLALMNELTWVVWRQTFQVSAASGLLHGRTCRLHEAGYIATEWPRVARSVGGCAGKEGRNEGATSCLGGIFSLYIPRCSTGLRGRKLFLGGSSTGHRVVPYMVAWCRACLGNTTSEEPERVKVYAH